MVCDTDEIGQAILRSFMAQKLHRRQNRRQQVVNRSALRLFRETLRFCKGLYVQIWKNSTDL